MATAKEKVLGISSEGRFVVNAQWIDPPSLCTCTCLSIFIVVSMPTAAAAAKSPQEKLKLHCIHGFVEVLFMRLAVHQ